MWTNGRMIVSGVEILYWVKHYEEPSERYGINGGRISKLNIIKQSGKIVASYERGWNIEPATKEAEIALNNLVREYN